MGSEKELPIYGNGNVAPKKRNCKMVWSLGLVLVGLSCYLLSGISNTQGYLGDTFRSFSGDDGKNPDSLCPIVEKVKFSDFVYESDTVDRILHDAKFRNQSIEKLLGAVKYPTEIYDEMTRPEEADSVDELLKIEPGWKYFQDFQKYLKKTFPKVHEHLSLDKVNDFGLVYTWKGKDENKKPLLLTAHYDVVPVQKETLDQWTFPPFTGGYDGKFLYGRGVSDCKDLLIGLLETVELLLTEDKFSPERTIILAFGYDEEAGGSGAQKIFKHLVGKYGPDSMLQIIDEGSSGYQEMEGLNVILPATGEKGYVDSFIELYTPGGHSSVPPKHTSIGILAKLLSDIEDAEFESVITNANPVLNQLQCLAEHSPLIDNDLRKNILKAHFDTKANEALLKYLRAQVSQKFLVTTSQAIDIISGGVKSNALPEHASALVNHRIAVEELVKSTSEKVLGQIKQIAEKHELGLIFEGQTVYEPTEHGYFNYTLRQGLEPAPVTPTQDEIWNLFGGSLRHFYEDVVFAGESKEFVFAPSLMTGNTDTKWYWDLTRNIFRYAPGLPNPHLNIHSVDEKTNFDGHLLIIAFYYNYLQVVDQLAQ
ncbi:hypothetical protein C7M61_002696 [Candidozyma pseudohaemuli]|uniref:Peptidase M20 dimerisation domain-containing protein n=1 Tax=Candidozyma pseudohaemuli TaxID=418784 RepID=A0A2P7YS14_9ASCO|nr:hypothetical protein C7M61_002696 [[Candida] pseudohaemulonii]PSK38757.1 hypothetical protein C7M61_002696 [[Candida] pseudohaemulonii]